MYNPILTGPGPDENDPFTISDPRDSHDVHKPAVGTDFSAACKKSGLEGKRIAVSPQTVNFLASQDRTDWLIQSSLKVPRHLFPGDKVVNAAFDNALKQIESLGATIVDDVKFSEFNSNFTYSDEEDWTLGLRVALRESSHTWSPLTENNI